MNGSFAPAEEPQVAAAAEVIVLPPAEPAEDGSEAEPAGNYEERLGGILSTVETTLREALVASEAEAARILDDARIEARQTAAAAEREAGLTLSRARDRAGAILADARRDAAAIASESERLSRQFMSQVNALLTAPPARTVGDPLSFPAPDRTRVAIDRDALSFPAHDPAPAAREGGRFVFPAEPETQVD